MKDVDVVIPVYDGLDETVACLDSVLQTIDVDWARIVVVNDCSPSPQIADYLHTLVALYPQLVLLENPGNLGFVATANRGMSNDLSRDVLLLNSDVEVSGDWLRRLREAAYVNEAVGSITPFSNNATICSFPNFCEDNPLPFGLSTPEIDQRAKELFTVEDVFDIPTGIGCCMYLRRDCLEQVGLFDVQTFGRGYGEENDWCQRAVAAGWRNVQLANCFIYHKGGVSFGAEQNPRIAHAMSLLDERYPNYHRSVQAFVAEDPAKAQRIQLLLDLFASQQLPKILFVSHKLGGGAQQHVNELASLYSEQALFLQITPEIEGRSVVLAVFDGGTRLKDGLYFDIEREYSKLVELLIELGIGRVHFHHTMGLPPQLWVLASELGCAYDLTVHDYYLINGNPTLTDAQARYVPHAASDFDTRCAEHYPLPPGVEPDMWRSNQCLLVENADRVIFPSADCCQRFLSFYTVKRPLVVRHPDYQLSQPYPEPVWRYRGGRPLRVLVLGALSREKGADVLESAASAMAGEAIEFHLLGYAYRALSSSVQTHGPYENSDVSGLVEGISPDVVWFPALWPETYSYTLSVALHMGLPVVVPNIGAFAERIKNRPFSVSCDWAWATADWCSFWNGLQVERAMPNAQAQVDTQPGGNQVDDGFYAEAYLAAIPAIRGELRPETRRGLSTNYHAGLPELSRSERILGKIWNISRSPIIAKCISIVPFRIQRAIKRRLSSRPMHDIVRRP